MMIGLILAMVFLLFTWKLLIGWFPSVRTVTKIISNILRFCWKKRETTHATEVEPRIFYRNRRD